MGRGRVKVGLVEVGLSIDTKINPTSTRQPDLYRQGYFQEVSFISRRRRVPLGGGISAFASFGAAVAA